MSNRLFLGRLSSRASERDVKDFFRGYGEILSISLKDGFGFVDLADARDAEDAIHDLNRKELCGSSVVVEEAGRGGSGGRGGRYEGDRFYQGGRGYDRAKTSRFPPPKRTEYRLIVENLSSRCSWQDLKDLVRSTAEATYADAHKEEKNVALLCFETHSDLKRVIKKFQGEEINGRKIKLIDDTRSNSRSRSRSRSPEPRGRRRSRSRSHSRSRSRSRSPPPKTRKRSLSNSRSRSRSPLKDRKRSPSSSRSRSPVSKGKGTSRSHSSGRR